jgi:hypothetical protein
VLAQSRLFEDLISTLAASFHVEEMGWCVNNSVSLELELWIVMGVLPEKSVPLPAQV